MTQTNDFTVESIIKKYQQRQEQLTHTAKEYKLNSFHSDKNKASNDLFDKSGSSTPQFSNITNRKERKDFYDNFTEKTQKKNQPYETFSRPEVISLNLNASEIQKRQYEKLLLKLDQTQQKLTRSERNYAQMWRKYQKMLKDSQKGSKQIQIEHRLKQKQAQQLQLRMESYEKQIENLKQCLNAKEGNISALRDKLNQKDLRMVETQRAFESLKSQFEMVKAKQQRIQEEQDKKISDNHKIVVQLKDQLSKFGDMLEEKEKEKKNLLFETEKNYANHKQQLEILRMSYGKVQEQYKQWIQSCNQEKLSIIETYEAKLRQNTKNITNNYIKTSNIQLLQQQAIKKNQQITHLIAENSKLTIELKSSKIQLQNVQRSKLQLIGKLSTLENGVIQKFQYNKSLQTSYNKLQNLYKSQQQKNKQLSTKYNLLNKQFQQLKNRCSVLFNEMESKKQQKNSQALEIIRLKKQIMVCRQQLQKSKNNQMSLNNKMNQSLAMMKGKTAKHDLEKEDIMTGLLAERLENAKLKQQLRQTKEVLQRQYHLSVQNMKRQLENQIKGNISRPAATAGYDMQKQQLYLQLRQLQKRYQMLASEVVTVDQMIGLASKVQRRHQPRK